MGLVGQVGDDLLEVTRDVADGHVLLGELRLQAGHLVGEALRQRQNRLLLRLLDELPLPCEDLLDGLDQLGFAQQIKFQVQPDPVAKVVECARHWMCGRSEWSFPWTLAPVTRLDHISINTRAGFLKPIFIARCQFRNARAVR
jgi:hypothetical protein